MKKDKDILKQLKDLNLEKFSLYNQLKSKLNKLGLMNNINIDEYGYLRLEKQDLISNKKILGLMDNYNFIQDRYINSYNKLDHKKFKLTINKLSKNLISKLNKNTDKNWDLEILESDYKLIDFVGKKKFMYQTPLMIAVVANKNNKKLNDTKTDKLDELYDKKDYIPIDFVDYDDYRKGIWKENKTSIVNAQPEINNANITPAFSTKDIQFFNILENNNSNTNQKQLSNAIFKSIVNKKDKNKNIGFYTGVSEKKTDNQM
ncbi:MAG: hypothetical protein ACOCRX_08905 [Candidatus Woesearchaeota archaeon]